MKNYFKTLASILGALILVLSFQNCKVVKINGQDIIIDWPVDKNDYQGDTYKMTYFDGGWYSPYPNFRANLTMEVNQEGKIDANLEVRNDNIATIMIYPPPPVEDSVCKIKGQVSVADYEELDELVKEAKKVEFNPCYFDDSGKEQCVHMADAGVEQLTSFRSSTTAKFAPEKVYLKHLGDGMKKGDLVFADAKLVRAKINLIIEKLKVGSKCEKIISPAVKSVKTVDYSFDGGFDRQLSKTNPVLKKINWKLSVLDNKLLVSGISYTKSFGPTDKVIITKRTFNDILVSESLRIGLSQVKFVKQQYMCLMVELFTEKGKLTYSDGKFEEGGFNCTASVRIDDPKQVFAEINKTIGFSK